MRDVWRGVRAFALAGTLGWTIARRRRLWLRLDLQRVQKVDLILQEVFLRPTALPAISPIQNKELEAERINLDSRLEADAQVVVVHLVELGTRVQQANVAGDRKQEVVVERW